MAQVTRTQMSQLVAVRKEFQRLQKRFHAIHKKTGYEDLVHGVLALEIAEHTVEEILEHTGLGGEIKHHSDAKAYRQAKEWLDTVRGLKIRPTNFLEPIRARIWKPP
jgi:RecB family endonuclease NucS